VVLAMQLAQRGTVAEHDVQLVVMAAVANHTAAAIHLAGSICQADDANTTGGRLDDRAATIGVAVDDAPNHTIWQSWGWLLCPKGAGDQVTDVQEVPADGTFTATLTCDLSRGYIVAGAELRAGVPYTIQTTIFLWHQGTPDQYLQAFDHPEQPGVLWGSNLAVDMQFTFH
jgi:hypothetical protein